MLPYGCSTSKDALRKAVGMLEQEKTRNKAIPRIALGQYPPRMLGDLMDEQTGDARLYAAAISEWRKGGPWFLERQWQLLQVATTMLEVHWPIDDLRCFAKSRLSRLARIKHAEHHWGSKPLGPLLASIRYSPDAEDRNLLAQFVNEAEPGAAQVAIAIMKNGLQGRTRWNMAEHWKKMPAHNYDVDWVAKLDSSKPKLFEQAMYAAPRKEELRKRLHEVG